MLEVVFKLRFHVTQGQASDTVAQIGFRFFPQVGKQKQNERQAQNRRVMPVRSQNYFLHRLRTCIARFLSPTTRGSWVRSRECRQITGVRKPGGLLESQGQVL